MEFKLLTLDDFLEKMNQNDTIIYFSEFEKLAENKDFFPEDIRFYILTDNNYIYSAAAVSSTYYHSNEWHIWEFQTNSKFTHKGYGSLLFKYIIDTLSGSISLCTLDSKAYKFWKSVLKKYLGIDISNCIIKGICPEEDRYLIKFMNDSQGSF